MVASKSLGKLANVFRPYGPTYAKAVMEQLHSRYGLEVIGPSSSTISAATMTTTTKIPGTTPGVTPVEAAARANKTRNKQE